jgi:uncharacterized protein (DUF1810 family)
MGCTAASGLRILLGGRVSKSRAGRKADGTVPRMSTQYDLERFVAAQDSIYERALSELVRGRKSGHWMWFIFPQIAGLGHSFMAKKYAISSLEEARAYLAHPVLGSRIRECARAVNSVEQRSLRQIFGYPDDLKFRSSMTLFSQAAPDDDVFRHAIEKYCDSTYDPLTLERLQPR